MKKITRRTFNRKVVAAGLAVFLGIGLTSTGFAAWVMSMDAEDSVDSNVTIGSISDASLTIADLAANSSFVFDAQATDTEGRVKHGTISGEASTGEDLTVIISGNISPLASLSEISVQLTLPEGVQNAIEAGYLQAPTCYGTDGSAYTVYSSATSYKADNFTLHEEANEDSGISAGDFTYVISFGWGAVFGNTNPGLYYDQADVKTPGNEKYVSDQIVRSTLNAFRDMVLAGSNTTYTVTVTATAK